MSYVGDYWARQVGKRIGVPVASVTALKALAADELFDGCLYSVAGQMWRYSLSSAVTGDDKLVATPDNTSTGRFLRCPGKVTLEMDFTYATADAAILYTIPTGALFRPMFAAWDIAADMTGGSSSAIGVSSSNVTGLTTKGDILGGGTGDVAAALTLALSPTPGTVGAVLTSANRLLFGAAKTFRFDRITSAFTAGSGKVLVTGDLIRNAGA